MGGSLCARSLRQRGSSIEAGARAGASGECRENAVLCASYLARLTQCPLRLRSACGACASRAQWLRLGAL